MDPQIQRLVHLQVLDARLAELRNRLQALPAQIAAVDARVHAARQRIAAANPTACAIAGVPASNFLGSSAGVKLRSSTV